MSIKIELVEVEKGRRPVLCVVCQSETRVCYSLTTQGTLLLGELRVFVCRKCADELHLHLLNTRKHIASLPNGDDGDEVIVSEDDERDNAAMRKIIEGSQSGQRPDDYIFKGYEICPKCLCAHTGGPGGAICSACLYLESDDALRAEKLRVSFDSSIEWGVPLEDSL